MVSVSGVREQVNEPVEIAGFIFKRYRYVTRRSDHQKNGQGNGRPQESPLLIGKSPSWLLTKQPLQLPGGMTWLPVLTALTAPRQRWEDGVAAFGILHRREI